MGSASSKKLDFCASALVPRPGQSHGFNLDSDEKDGEEPREQRERSEETQRPSWDRKAPADDRRKKREDSEPRLFMACDDAQDTQDPIEGADKRGMFVIFCAL